MPPQRFKHIFLPTPPAIKKFTSTSAGGSKICNPNRDRDTHSKYLSERLNRAWQESLNERAVTHAVRDGVYIEFKSDPGAVLVTKSLEDMHSKKVRLLNVRTEGHGDKQVTYATVYVANEKKKYFVDKIRKYAEEKTAKGNFKNATLVESITDIQKAILVESFWMDSKDLIPSENKEWCEVWLSSDSEHVIAKFDKLLLSEEIECANGLIKFPERIVKMVFANKSQLERLTTVSDDIAEYRLAKETVAFWIDMENKDQSQWVQDLLKRCKVAPNPRVAICILDSGVNNGHPLLFPILNDADCQAVDITWGNNDHTGHGTLMAGVAGYGDLKACLSGTQSISIWHGLESVTIVPPLPKKTKEKFWGFFTHQAVSKAEIQAPGKERILCMAIAAPGTRDRGRPSAWSGKLDQLTSGVDDDKKRLFIVSAGNTDPKFWSKYPDAQLTDSVNDPGQSWNALTVGAYTTLDQIIDQTYKGYSPVAQSGELSPFSTTSLDWDSRWPIKPEIVMEGGNVLTDGNGINDDADDVSLLSTYKDPAVRHFGKFNMTSAATAQAAWFAAQIMDIYPNIWPETVRALMVHSAEWTDRLKKQFLPDLSKDSFKRLLRICGYGVPDLNRALYSASNSLTLISQRELQPYESKTDRSGYKTKEMHLYALPWPKQVLQDLPDETQVKMRVTLSYFVEPGPGEIGWQDRYRYASYGLRFDVKSPSESEQDFVKRINAAARDEGEDGGPGTQSAASYWTIGSKVRDKGSVHSDIWNGSATDLAASGVIAVYPIIGWWRERTHLGRWNSQCRYSLIVSISTPEEKVDIYTPVANQIGITIPVPIYL